jgi:hypothetical protein
VRRRLVVAIAAMVAAVAFASVPAPAASQPASIPSELDASAFQRVGLDGAPRRIPAVGGLEAALRSEGFDPGDGQFTEAGAAPDGPVVRPRVDQPASAAETAWKPPRYVISGYATFYDHGTTAMRLPRGTVVRICGDGGCIERVITDYGPHAVKGRIVDLYRPDFFAICGCQWFAGSAWVTVSVY